MTMLFLVPESDESSVRAMDPPVGLAVVSQGAGGPPSDALLDGVPVSINELAARCIGAVGLTARGLATLKPLLDRLADLRGTPVPVCELAGAEAEAPLMRFVAETMSAGLSSQAARILTLNRSIVALRQTHEQMQGAFSRVESYVAQHGLAARRRILTLAPGAELPTVRLEDGVTVRQRLPVASDGISDITLHVEGISGDGSGYLAVALLTREDGARRAEWALAEADIAVGPLRLSLHAALEAAALTPVVEMTWHGQGTLRLAAALRNPDPRFRLHLGERMDPRVLALDCWSCLPGSEVPVAVGAVLPSAPGSRPIRYKVIDATLLAAAEDLTPESQYSRFLPEEGALVVHPMADGVSVMRLAGAVPQGAIHLVAEVSTRSDSAADIDYALALASGTAPGAEPEVVSDWIRMPALATGEVHLPLPEPLDAVHDLYLMTRLSERPGNPAFGWARFTRIRVTLG